jgi:MarR family transcriptional regulator, organic hydroperoxide resistance regulator
MFRNDPQSSLGYQTRATHRAFDRLLQQRLAPHGLQNAHWYVLRILWEREGLSQRELSALMNLSESSLVSPLAGMESGGLIVRQRDERDRRRLIVRLTPKGRRLKARLLPVAAELNALAAGSVPAEELRTYLRVARTLRDNLLRAAARPVRPADTPTSD